jgi:Rieske Fe-S protein
VTRGVVGRREFLAAGLAAGVAACAGCQSGDKSAPRARSASEAAFGDRIDLGPLDDFPSGSLTRNLVAQCWIVRYDAEQAEREGVPDGSIVLLHHRCPHLGCTLPYLENFTFNDPRSDSTVRGWFRCPCHGGTFSISGLRVFGPSPRSLDSIAAEIVDGRLIADTGDITLGAADGAPPTISPVTLE